MPVYRGAICGSRWRRIAAGGNGRTRCGAPSGSRARRRGFGAPSRRSDVGDGTATRYDHIRAHRGGGAAQVIGESPPPVPSKNRRKGEAVRIFTVASSPEGAGRHYHPGRAVVDVVASPSRNLRLPAGNAPAGVDFRKGEILLARGTHLPLRDLSLAAGKELMADLSGAPPPNRDSCTASTNLSCQGCSTPAASDRLFQWLRAAGSGPPVGSRDPSISALHRYTVEPTTRGILRATRDSAPTILITTAGLRSSDSRPLVKQSL